MWPLFEHVRSLVWALLCRLLTFPRLEVSGSDRGAPSPSERTGACRSLPGGPTEWSTDHSYSQRTGGGQCGELSRWWQSSENQERDSRHHGWRWSRCWRKRKELNRAPCEGGRRRGRCGMGVPAWSHRLDERHGWQREWGSSISGAVCETSGDERANGSIHLIIINICLK